MRLSNPIAIKFAALCVSSLMRACLGTVDLRVGFEDEQSDPIRARRKSIYLLWHETMLLGAYAYVPLGVAPLISRHRDGELIAQIVRMFRGQVVRGSTDDGRCRGGVAALREMIRPHGYGHVAITPDGPRGPRRVVQEGSIYLASRSARPLVPSGVALETPWRASSWDELALPRPFCRAVILLGRPIDVPAGLDRDALERYRLEAQRAMDDLQHRAERLAHGITRQDEMTLLSKARALNHHGDGNLT